MAQEATHWPTPLPQTLPSWDFLTYHGDAPTEAATLEFAMCQVSTEVTFVLMTSFVMVRNWGDIEGLPGLAGQMDGYPGGPHGTGSKAGTA